MSLRDATQFGHRDLSLADARATTQLSRAIWCSAAKVVRVSGVSRMLSNEIINTRTLLRSFSDKH
jgi:hypothetical protein